LGWRYSAAKLVLEALVRGLGLLGALTRGIER
jgi:hypothetical protein